MAAAGDITLFIDPPSYHYQRDALFDGDNTCGETGNYLAPYIHLKDWFASRGIRVHTADWLLRGEKRTGRNLYVTTGIWTNYRALTRRPDVTLSAFFALECPIVEPSLYRELRRAQSYFKRIFSWSDSPSLERFVGAPLRCEQFWWPQSFNGVHEAIWSRGNRKLLVMINANKLPRIFWQELYTERLRAVEFFSRSGEIDLYGVGWDGPPYRVGTTWVPGTVLRAQRAFLREWQRLRPDPLLVAARRVYCGPTASKAETLGKYTFALCFENAILKGWITEKLFDCFFAGTIPIYWGATDVEAYVPPECFIDMRRFGNYEELRAYLKSLTEAQIEQYRESAREYLRSPQYRPFTKEAFTELFARIVEEDAGVQLPR